MMITIKPKVEKAMDNKSIDGYDKMLKDFMSQEGKHVQFLTEEQWWTIHEMGNGVEDLYNTPARKWSDEMVMDHIFKSSVDSKKRMVDYILDMISIFSLAEIHEPLVS